MDVLELLRLNLLSPMVLAFFLGVLAVGLGSDLTFPEGLYTALSLYLLFAIGFKGGVELSHTPARAIALPALATLLLGLLTPTVAYLTARRFLRLDGTNAAALAAHYGSVSAVTFLAALSFVQASGHRAEGFMPTLVALLEVPGVIIGILLARRFSSGGRLGEAIQEVLTGKSVFLMVGGLLVGLLSGEEGMKKVEAFFVAPFQGALTLFLLELGMVAARRLADLRRLGVRLVVFGMAVPVLHGNVGLVLAKWAGLSLGGAVVLATMAASASYIAAPAAVRLALPQANPSLYLAAALGVTFPFNLVLGIPLYYAIALRLWG
ncbi:MULTISPECIES: sodium-dependent bicarbonate transport family permease [unclassified Meiothermus]|uniref:sodium-dependent bicarbonate transport family permease n=1 Tax=unclassified Meiothermus TaxID=370471 RepID=UPI000D7C21DB|nr:MULTISPECIES: sodium-dependent bicarbonate transport family permease [unclassified Meiothermus]PZA07364.1 sodium-dependent bicarbonate transport family permease [Meiothermus sp. Pnk-1]RYM37358.1 sodium-dependent bicarbonate transport family permease [Meiothermus sp. PNK-Is4]